LIYLDAGYSYAFYDRSRGDLLIDSVEFRKELEQLTTQKSDPTTFVQELLQTALPGLERDLQEKVKDLQTMPAALRGAQETDPVSLAIKAGEQKYTDIRVPVLAIFAIPHDLGPNPGIDPAAWAAFEARDAVKVGAQADAFEKGIPSARVIRLPHADHYIFLSNEAEVLRAMIGFSASLR